MTTQEHGLARRMWHQLEPVHAVFWYAPEVFTEAAAPAAPCTRPVLTDHAPASRADQDRALEGRGQVSGSTGPGHRAQARAMFPAPDRIPPG
jgi:hypothetical protein